MADNASVLDQPRIDLAATPEFDLGALRVRPALRQVGRSEEFRELEPRIMKVLVALARERPAVVSRDRLIELCWDGRVVSDDALNRCILALRHVARDFAEAGFAIETVPRIGYRLVEEGAAPADDAGAAPEPTPAAAKKRWLAWAGLLGLFAVLLAGFAAYRQTSASSQAPTTIAVLPFRNLAPGDPYFAEGMSEEILTRLSRQPAFKVAGRTSSSLFRNAADLREVGRKLDVDYILEGSVRTQHRTVRVEAALVQASDGKRLWAKRFDGNLDDVFAIQDEIGTSVAQALALKLAPARAAAPRPAVGEAYNLYLTARGLIRTRDRNYSQASIELLTQAIRIDPGYAPAWARLSEATRMAATPKGRPAMIAAQAPAEMQARRALALDPNLAEGHAALGVLLGFGSPEAQSHLRRAGQLDPNSAETQIWMGIAHRAAGEFGAEVAAYRRAYEIDPLWFRTSRDLAIALADRGNRAQAEAIAKGDTSLLARVAWSFGDFSEAVRLWRAAIRTSPYASPVPASGIGKARYLTGLAKQPPLTAISPPAADIGRGSWIPWLPTAPSPAEWRDRNGDAVSELILHGDNLYAVKLMLNTGRSAELLATYDSPVGLQGIRRGQRLRAEQLWDVPPVALVLRSGGREAEARRLLAEADAMIAVIQRREATTPFSFDASAAGVWAVQGRTDQALSALERAWQRGWRTIYLTGPRDLAEDPAYRGLRGNPRFERLRAQFAEHFRREGEEIGKLPQ